MRIRSFLAPVAAFLAGMAVMHVYSGVGRMESRGIAPEAAYASASPGRGPSGDPSLDRDARALPIRVAPPPPGAQSHVSSREGVVPSADSTNHPATPRPAHATRPQTPVGADVAPAIAYGPAELRYFTGQYLNDEVQALLSTRDFDRGLTELQAEGGAVGADLQQVYRMELEDALRVIKAPARLDRFACATNLCAGALRTPRTDWTTDWLHELHQPRRLPMPTLSTRSLRIDEHNYEVRLLFTTRGQGGFSTRVKTAQR